MLAALGFVLALGLVNGLLVLPVDGEQLHPADLARSSFARISLEWIGVLGLLAMITPLRRRFGRAMRHGAALAVMIVVGLKLGELAMRTALGRPLNLYFDIHLVSALANLLVGNFGATWSVVIALGLGAAAVGLHLLVIAAIRMVQGTLDGHRALRLGIGIICIGMAGAAAAQPRSPEGPSGTSPFVADAVARITEQVRHVRGLAAAREAFHREEAHDRLAGSPDEGLLSRLEGADVLIVFIESYGRTALDDPRHAPATVPLLEQFEQALAGRGLHAASGWFASPTFGGSSWLAHGTVQSGLRLDTQLRYDLMVTGQRRTLTQFFVRAGYRTVAANPAMTLAWPEGEHFGFDRIYRAADLGYAGPAYGWVTMPDQFTLDVVQRIEREAHRGPFFVQVALITSHSPWTPIPPVLEDWSQIGDGTIFAAWADDGPPPERVWSDAELMRAQYRRAIAYELRLLQDYASRHADRRTLLILLGDHQPIRPVSGSDAGHDVPVHVISGDPALLAPFHEWGFAPGMRPGADTPVRPMAAFRDWFVQAFSASSR